jgi:hypothetical protein
VAHELLPVELVLAAKGFVNCVSVGLLGVLSKRQALWANVNQGVPLISGVNFATPLHETETISLSLLTSPPLSALPSLPKLL